MTRNLRAHSQAWLYLWLSFFPFSGMALSDDLPAQRALYLQAEHAFKKNDPNYKPLSQKLIHYPLYPYLVYQEHRQAIKNNSPSLALLEKIEDFEKNYNDCPLPSLRNLWLHKAAEKKAWELYLKGYKPSTNEILQCHYHFAQYQVTHDNAALKNATPLWRVAHKHPKECTPLFDAFKQSGFLSETLLEERVALALQAKNFTLAQSLSEDLPAKKRTQTKLWIKTLQSPTLLLDEKYLSALPDDLPLLAQSVQLLARVYPAKAKTWWEQYGNKFAFAPAEKNQILHDIGVYLTVQKNPDARAWLQSLPAQAFDNALFEWQIRLALSSQDWKEVLKLIDALPLPLRSEFVWRYWHARALFSLNQKKAARKEYASLAKIRNFYGFLASMHLGQPITLSHHAVAFNPALAQTISALPAIQRFEELILLGKKGPARVEWFRALSTFNEVQIATAAQIAHGMKLYDISIATISKTGFTNDVFLRFPLAYSDSVLQKSEALNIDPAWIFAIIRQESAFYTDAVSHAGARGLMQLMPKTAHMLAKGHALPLSGDTSLHRPDINIPLGIAYINDLESRNHHPILTTAAYNAGPTRVFHWHPAQTLDPDLWIETIPYKETREYVKNVIAFTAIYHYRLNKPSSLAQIMKAIPGKHS